MSELNVESAATIQSLTEYIRALEIDRDGTPMLTLFDVISRMPGSSAQAFSSFVGKPFLNKIITGFFGVKFFKVSKNAVITTGLKTLTGTEVSQYTKRAN